MLRNKYLVIKDADIMRFLGEDELYQLEKICKKINECRRLEGKKEHDYLVLNRNNTINEIIKNMNDY